MLKFCRGVHHLFAFNVGTMHVRTALPVWTRSALGLRLSTAFGLSLCAGAVGDTGSAPAGRTLTLSPSSFDAASGLLQLDARLSFAAPQSRLLVAFSSTASAPVSTSCVFDGAAATLTAVVGTWNSSRDDACTGTCPPSLDSTCGFEVQQVHAQGSSRYSGHVQVWLSEATQVARVFNGAVSLQIPLASLALALGVIKPLKCLILVWCLALVCCVLTPVKWLPKPPTSSGPPLPLAPPPPHPAVPLRSTLHFCAAQPGSSITFVNGAVPAGDTIYVGETYCLEQRVYNLPRGATLVAHALYLNASAVPLAAGTQAYLVTPGPLSMAPAAVRFPFTFPDVGLMVLDSVSVFHIGGVNLSATATGGHRFLPPVGAPAKNASAVITQLAEFNISVANETLPVSRAEQEFLSAHLATAFIAVAHKLDAPAVQLTSFRRHRRL